MSGTNRCLDLPNRKIQNGLIVETTKCNKSKTQKWSEPDKLGRIHSLKNKSFCLDIPWGTMEAGNKLQIYSCHKESNQQWGRDFARSILEKKEMKGHNPSKCVENKGFDGDCCAVKGTAECKSGFKFVDTDIVCWDGGDYQAFNYYCVNTDKKEVK